MTQIYAYMYINNTVATVHVMHTVHVCTYMYVYIIYVYIYIYIYIYVCMYMYWMYVHVCMCSTAGLLMQLIFDAPL